jgi:hypothetical protein
MKRKRRQLLNTFIFPPKQPANDLQKQKQTEQLLKTEDPQPNSHLNYMNLGSPFNLHGAIATSHRFL